MCWGGGKIFLVYELKPSPQEVQQAVKPTEIVDKPCNYNITWWPVAQMGFPIGLHGERSSCYMAGVFFAYLCIPQELVYGLVAHWFEQAQP